MLPLGDALGPAWAGTSIEPGGELAVGSGEIRARVAPDGHIEIVLAGRGHSELVAPAETTLDGCRPDGAPTARALSDGSVLIRRRLAHDRTGERCALTERLSAADDSIRWDIEAKGLGGPWSTPIETRLVWPDPQRATFWTAWGDSGSGRELVPGWVDPLEPVPLGDLALAGRVAHRQVNGQSVSGRQVPTFRTRA